MKKLLLHIGLLLTLIVTISVILCNYVYPILKLTDWTQGSDLMYYKNGDLHKTGNNCNTLFIGSSRVHRQVNTAVVDSVAGTSSYNFGVNWLFVPESFYVYENIISEHPGKFEIVIIELSKIRSVDYTNLHTNRTYYWYNASLFYFAVEAIASSTYAWWSKVALTAIHAISYADKLLNLGYGTTALQLAGTRNSPAASYLPTGHINGFVPLDLEAEKTQLPEEDVGNRRMKFLNDTTVVTKRRQISERMFNKYLDPELRQKNLNHNYARNLSRMIKTAASKNIHLIFLLSPRIDKAQYDELIPLFYSLPESNRIQLANGVEYPEFYLTEYSFDETHLNGKGAELYSRVLGDKIRLILNQ